MHDIVYGQDHKLVVRVYGAADKHT